MDIDNTRRKSIAVDHTTNFGALLRGKGSASVAIRKNPAQPLLDANTLSLSIKEGVDKSDKKFKKPLSTTQRLHCFWTNSHVERWLFILVATAAFYPTLVSTILVTLAYVLLSFELGCTKCAFTSFVNVPQRLLFQKRVAQFLTGLLVVFSIWKLVIMTGLTGENVQKYDVLDKTWGIYLKGNLPLGPDSYIDWFQSYTFELVALLSFVMIWYRSATLYSQGVVRGLPKLAPYVYLNSGEYGASRRTQLVFFGFFAIYEIFLVPNLLEFPILLILMIQIIVVSIERTELKQEEKVEEPCDDFQRAPKKRWCTNAKLTTFLVSLIKAFLILQVFEYLFVHIASIKAEIIERKEDDFEGTNSLILWIFRVLGHVSYQSSENFDRAFVIEHMVVTMITIFFAETYLKAKTAHYNHLKVLEEEAERRRNQPSFGFDNLVQAKAEIDELTFYKNQSKTCSGKLIQTISAVLGRDDYGRDEFLSDVVENLPIFLLWILRFQVGFLAYMYNSYVGFYHLCWVLLSFILPTQFFFGASILIFYPIVIAEFVVLYLSNIPNFADTAFFDKTFMNQYKMQMKTPTLELAFMFSGVLFTSLMIPAFINLRAYAKATEVDKSQTFLTARIMSNEYSTFWKFLTIFLLNLHTYVLFTMLFIGASSFNMFQLGCMFFFITYTASEWLFRKTSILLPIFVSFFIAVQYYWSLVYSKFDVDEEFNKRDFFHVVDGWTPPEDSTEFYWARTANWQLFILLAVVSSLHLINTQFPDAVQNREYLRACDENITQRFPVGTKWAKRVGSIFYQAMIYIVLVAMAVGLLRQEPHIINLVYVMLFLINFGVIATAVKKSDYITCVTLAKIIKFWSAIVVFTITTYCIVRFEWVKSGLDEYALKKKEEGTYFFWNNLSLFGLFEDEDRQVNAIKLNVVYLIIGTLLQNYFTELIRSEDDLDLFDWENAFKTKESVDEAFEKVRFTAEYRAWKWHSWWSWMDSFCLFSFIVTNTVIVFYAINTQINLYFGFMLSIIVYAYLSSSKTFYQSHTAGDSGDDGQDIKDVHYDLQEAADASRNYKKTFGDLFLRLRMKVWKIQYFVTLVFLIAGYLTPLIDGFVDKDGKNVEVFKAMRFYFYWIGLYYPTSLQSTMQLIQPGHVVFLFIIFQKQTQNWLYNRGGLTMSDVKNFTKLDYYRSLNEQGVKLLPVVANDYKNYDQVMFQVAEEKSAAEQRFGEAAAPAKEQKLSDLYSKTKSEVGIEIKNRKSFIASDKWKSEDIVNSIVAAWKFAKVSHRRATLSVVQDALFGEVLSKSVVSKNVQFDKLNESEFDAFVDIITQVFGIDFASKAFTFEKLSVMVEIAENGINESQASSFVKKDIVIYLSAKDRIEEIIVEEGLFDEAYIPFLPVSFVDRYVKTQEQELSIEFLDKLQRLYNVDFKQLAENNEFEGYERQEGDKDGGEKPVHVARINQSIASRGELDQEPGATQAAAENAKSDESVEKDSDLLTQTPEYSANKLEDENKAAYEARVKTWKVELAHTIRKAKQTIELQVLKNELKDMVDRKYAYEFIFGVKKVVEQCTLLLLLTSVVLKCNIISLFYLIPVIVYLRSRVKVYAMMNQSYFLSVGIVIQYGLYLLNLTSVSAYTPFPDAPYPSAEVPSGIYNIPVFYKLAWGRDMINAYFFALGVEQTTLKNLWLDVFNLIVVNCYLFYYRNPVLQRTAASYTWDKAHQRMTKERKHKEVCLEQIKFSELNLAKRSAQADGQEWNEQIERKWSEDFDEAWNEEREKEYQHFEFNFERDEAEEQAKGEYYYQINFSQKLERFHELMQKIYPDEINMQSGTRLTQSNQRLRELKMRSPYYQVFKNGKVLIFTTWHILTLVLILLMAMLRGSLISFGYVLMMVPFLKESANVLQQHKNYLAQQQEIDLLQNGDPEDESLSEEDQQRIMEFRGKSEKEQAQAIAAVVDAHTWAFVKLIKYLSWYSFLDFTSQVIYQMPFIQENLNLEYLGWRKVYVYDINTLNYDYMVNNPDSYAGITLDIENAILQCLNCLIMCAISTQAEIFKSRGYEEFIQEKKGLDELNELANMKKFAITFNYNNLKLMKILAIQKTKQQILGTVERIKLNVFLWRKAQQRSLVEEYLHQFGQVDEHRLNNLKPKKDQVNEPLLLNGEDEAETPQTEEFAKVPLLNREVEDMKKHFPSEFVENDESAARKLFNDFLYRSVQKMDNEDETAFNKRMRDLLSKMIKEAKIKKEQEIEARVPFIIEYYLPRRARIYLWLMSYTNQLIFIHKVKFMDKILKDVRTGKSLIETDLEQTIRYDLSAYVSRGAKWPEKLWDVPEGFDWQKDLRQTADYCSWRHISFRIFAAIFRVIISNTMNTAYFAMVFSLFTNAGIVSIVYPFLVFGYALLEETRPSQKFWNQVLSYSMVVISLKFLINLSIMTYLLEDSFYHTLNAFMKFGLHNITEDQSMLRYMAPELMVITAVLWHQIVSQFYGLYDKTERDVEDVPQSIRRIFTWQNFTEYEQKPDAAEAKVEGEEEEEEQKAEDKSQEVRASETSKVEPEVQEPAVAAEPDQSAGENNEPATDRSAYFERLFPNVQQQKPGKDYYGTLMVVQFILCVFLIYNFNKFGAQGPFEETNIFKTEMVVILFYMILTIILERYVARTDTRVQKQKNAQLTKNMKFEDWMLFKKSWTSSSLPSRKDYAHEYVERPADENQGESELKQKVLVEKSSIDEKYDRQYVTEFVLQKLRFQDLGDMEHLKALNRLKETQDVQIEESETAVTKQQTLKFWLHWTNLILIHIYVFWYLPIESNIKLYGEPACGPDMIYGCREFRDSYYLKWFYVLYCWYFYLSARQISQGLPSYKRASSMMQWEGNDIDYSGDYGNALHQLFVTLPLAQEIRGLLDFSMSYTALDMFQTMQLFQYHSDFYLVKTANTGYNPMQLGKNVSGFGRWCCGYVCTAFMLTFLVGPFFMFSALGGMTNYNPVKTSNVQFWININETTNMYDGPTDGVFNPAKGGMSSYPYKIYDNESPAMYDFDQTELEEGGYSKFTETKFFSPEQIQKISPAYYSDTAWIASDDVRQNLNKYVCIAYIKAHEKTVGEGHTHELEKEAAYKKCSPFQKDADNTKSVTIGFELKYTFDREGPVAAKTAAGSQSRVFNSTDNTDVQLLGNFMSVVGNNCKDGQKNSVSLYISDFFNEIIMLKDTTDVAPLEPGLKKEQDDAPDRTLVLTYKCKDQWAIGQLFEDMETHVEDKDIIEPIQFIVFSQQIAVGFIQGYSILTFYTGIILIFGMYMRPIYIFLTQRAYIYEVNYPDAILRLCESVHLMRHQEDLRNEEINYRILLEILRSPELLKSLTGSNLKGGAFAPSDNERDPAYNIPKAFK